jgi:Holliday junction resolvasome RuvABC ATP-dependent DNA helicase subunit
MKKPLSTAPETSRSETTGGFLGIARGFWDLARGYLPAIGSDAPPAQPLPDSPAIQEPSECAPRLLRELIGQNEIMMQMGSKLNFSKLNKCPLPHLLLCGPPSSGKRTLAKIVPNELGTTIQEVSAKTLQSPGSLLPFLTNASEASVLLLKDIDCLKDDIIDFLVGPLTDYRLDIVLGDSKNARTVSMPLKRFTLIGTTSKPSRVDKRLIPWLTPLDFKPYTSTELVLIVCSMLKSAGFEGSEDISRLIVSFSDGSLEKASVMIKRLQGLAQKPLSLTTAKEILEWMGYKSVTSIDIVSRLRSMSGTEFEEYVASVFKGLGFAVEYTPVTGDHGIDLILRKGKELAVVQCKRWDGAVGEPVIRDFLGSMASLGIKLGYMVTAGQFTAQAIEFGEKNGIRMIELDELLFMGKEPQAGASALFEE